VVTTGIYNLDVATIIASLISMPVSKGWTLITDDLLAITACELRIFVFLELVCYGGAGEEGGGGSARGIALCDGEGPELNALLSTPLCNGGEGILCVGSGHAMMKGCEAIMSYHSIFGADSGCYFFIILLCLAFAITYVYWITECLLF
jgi:hypothetical protein